MRKTNILCTLKDEQLKEAIRVEHLLACHVDPADRDLWQSLAYALGDTQYRREQDQLGRIGARDGEVLFVGSWLRSLRVFATGADAHRKALADEALLRLEHELVTHPCSTEFESLRVEDRDWIVGLTVDDKPFAVWPRRLRYASGQPEQVFYRGARGGLYLLGANKVELVPAAMEGGLSLVRLDPREQEQPQLLAMASLVPERARMDQYIELLITSGSPSRRVV